MGNDNQILSLQHNKDQMENIMNERIEALDTLVSELRTQN
jgi:hypothetical protein